MNENNENLAEIRHSFAHLLAAAVLEIYPDTLNTIGPAIDNGFYYDFEFSAPLSENDLEKIESKMRELLPSWSTFSKVEIAQDEALSEYSDNDYKQELIKEIADKGEVITLYTVGNFTDLCRGGHAENPNIDITPDSFKLDRIAGAYWR